MTAPTFLRSKAEGKRLSMITCYDYTFARLLSQSPVDAILVGDSAAMAMHGHPSTLHATVSLMRLHTEAVVRGAGGKFVVSDMPFLSYRKGVRAALNAAQALMTAGANAVKLEGVTGHEDVVQRLVESGIPVMGHLGLQPQSVQFYGGYRVQGGNGAQAAEILRQARLLEELGAFATVLECVPASLAAEVTLALKIPVIGIGAGAACDGQILVLQDLLGLNIDFHPRFVRNFGSVGACVLAAIESYDRAVKSQEFPSPAESFR
jgi:3-methyl-2-oxobutanoate hydroxymethyltransferase